MERDGSRDLAFLWNHGCRCLWFLNSESTVSVATRGETLCWGREREGQCDVPAGYRALLQLELVLLCEWSFG